MVMAMVHVDIIVILILVVIIDDHGADQFSHGHLLRGTGIELGGFGVCRPPCAPSRCCRGALTSPLELIRAVRRLSPEPQLLWAFHTMLLGGLWVAPAPEAQI